MAILSDVPAVILDTNVVYAALRSKRGASYRLLQLVDSEEVRIGLTNTLVREYEEVCKRGIASTTLEPSDIDRLMDALCLVGTCGTVHYRVRPQLPDADDEMVLEAAIATGCRIIVTHNVRDFSGASRYGIEAITPGELLHRLGVSK